MGSAHGFIALDQFAVGSIEEQDAVFDAQIVQMVEDFGEVIEITSGPHVHDRGELVDFGT